MELQWWQYPEMQGHLQNVLIRINGAQEVKFDVVERCKRLFDALNQSWIAYAHWYLTTNGQYFDPQKPKDFPSDHQSFAELVTRGISPDAQASLVSSKNLQRLVYLEPQVLNHDNLKKSGYVPNSAVSDELRKSASEGHKKLLNGHKTYEAQLSDQHRSALLKKMAVLCYIVRSNIAHGEKTQYGPDKAKIERDQQVCDTIAPLLEEIFNLMFDQPNCKLVSYGTLAPGEPNHSVVVELDGDWKECIVNGSASQMGGLKKFVWNPNAIEIHAHLLKSVDLPQFWSRLDRFEGQDYKRILVPVKVAYGFEVANIYE